MVPEFVPAFVSRTRSCAPEVVSFPAAAPLPITTSPVPLLTREMLPLAASVMVIYELLVPLLVESIKSYAPLEVTLPVAPPFPTWTKPVPLGFSAMLLFELLVAILIAPA